VLRLGRREALWRANSVSHKYAASDSSPALKSSNSFSELYRKPAIKSKKTYSSNFSMYQCFDEVGSMNTFSSLRVGGRRR
jgi:hypothetical protein